MTSLRKRFANARNAQRCTGPKTTAGKSRAARNAFQHGLNLPVLADATLAPEIEDLARKIAGEGASPRLRELAARIAEAQVDVMRARRAKVQVMNEAPAAHECSAELLRIDRYEGRAFSRRKFAIRDFRAAQIAQILAKRNQRAKTQ